MTRILLQRFYERFLSVRRIPVPVIVRTVLGSETKNELK